MFANTFMILQLINEVKNIITVVAKPAGLNFFSVTYS